MTQAISKRTFLGYLGAVPLGLAALKFTGQGGFISSASAADETAAASGFFKVPPLPYAVNALEAAIDAVVLKAVQQAEGNVSAAARLLGVSRDVVRYRLKGGGTAPKSGD